MRIAYCEDEKSQYIFLKELLDRWEQEYRISCDLTVYASAEEMLFENMESFPFEFILLDIELDKMNGIELARRIRQKDKEVMIAFLSNSREYVFEGYEVGAVRYLLKPLSGQQLFPLLDLLLRTLKEEKPHIILEAGGEKIKLALEEIHYVEALGHYVAVHTKERVYEMKKNMNEIQSKLGGGFLAPHRSYLVNIRAIERITRTDCILEGGDKIPISRNSYRAVNQAFIEFYKGGEL